MVRMKKNILTKVRHTVPTFQDSVRDHIMLDSLKQASAIKAVRELVDRIEQFFKSRASKKGYSVSDYKLGEITHAMSLTGRRPIIETFRDNNDQLSGHLDVLSPPIREFSIFLMEFLKSKGYDTSKLSVFDLFASPQKIKKDGVTMYLRINNCKQEVVGIIRIDRFIVDVLYFPQDCQ